MHRRVFAAGLIGLSSTISALAQQSAPYLGRWSEEPAWCANTGHTDEKPIVITASAIETFASYCRVLSVTRQGAARSATWRIRTSCRDEGQMENEPRTRVTFVLRVDGDKLAMRDSTGVQNYTRCKRWPSSQGTARPTAVL